MTGATHEETPTNHHVYLGLGSNIPDRDAHLAAALEELAQIVTIERVSSVFDTAPMIVMANLGRSAFCYRASGAVHSRISRGASGHGAPPIREPPPVNT